MLTITIPTTGRKERLNDCLRSIEWDCAIRIGARKEEDVDASVLKDPRVLVLYNEDMSIVEFQNAMAPVGDNSPHLPITDDIVFHPNALYFGLRAMEEIFPDDDGIIGFNAVNMRTKDKCRFAFMLIGSKFLQTRLNGQPFHEGYKHFYADIELGLFAERLGRFHFCEAARLDHYHPSAGHSQDRTHIFNRAEKWEHDNRLFIERNPGCLK